jgi:REP element-mobilizing transposase RayT
MLSHHAIDFGRMTYQPFTGVPCAYQLHYHFCFQTKFSRSRFSHPGARDHLAASLESICNHSKYHLLGRSVEEDRLYCLVSLRADDIVSMVARPLKSNLAREFNLQFPADTKDRSLWSIGYYVGRLGPHAVFRR